MKPLCGSPGSRKIAAIGTVCCVIFCGFATPSANSSATSPATSSAHYDAAIQEGRGAAQTLIDEHGASAITIALVDRHHIIWSQAFGRIDPNAAEPPTDTTMFGIGSVSKMFATMAVMKLVDDPAIKLDLDTPVVTYLPNFKMASKGYEKITVRMLLNHSAGFPGTDYRNLLIRTRVPEYLNQVLKTLSESRLKAPPGYMNVYCNDCFTVVEALIQATTGKSYAQFVKDEILTPLHMDNTRYPIEAFKNGSYARPLKNGMVRPQEFVNSFATGGAYSTARDMAQIAMLFLGGGTVGSRSILSASSVSEMAKDQTVNTFNPVHNKTWAYGLGWDSVTQPGLLAVGLDGWAKGGDSNDYGVELIVSPRAGLGIVVIGASGFSSEKAKAIAERVLLRALAENKRIANFPSPLTAIEPQRDALTKSHFANIPGEYAANGFIAKLFFRPDRLLTMSLRSDSGWTPSGQPMKAISGGCFRSSKSSLSALKVINADLMGKQTQYMVGEAPAGYGHYVDYGVAAEKVHKKFHQLSPAWRERLRLPSAWLVVNENPDELTWNGMDPRLRLVTIPKLDGLIAIRTPNEPDKFQILDPSESDTEAKMMLIIPQLNGRDLDDLSFVKGKSGEWARLGSYIHQPIASVSQLPEGKTETITIGSEGYAEWRTIAHGNPVQITITTKGPWRLYDATFKSLASGKGSGVASLPAGSGLGYLTLFGSPGQTITADVAETGTLSW